jgi:hypothetical protein
MSEAANPFRSNVALANSSYAGIVQGRLVNTSFCWAPEFTWLYANGESAR